VASNGVSAGIGGWSGECRQHRDLLIAVGPDGVIRQRPSIAAAPLAPGAGTGRPRRGASRYGWHPVNLCAHLAQTVVPSSQREHRCATGVRRRGPLASPSAKSLVILTVSLPVQSAAQGEQPFGSVQHVGSAKPRTQARRCWFERWRLSDIRRRLRLPVHINGGRTHGSHAVSLRVRSKRPWSAASVGFTKRAWGREGDAHPHPVVAMEPEWHHPLRLARSCWLRQSAKLLRSEDRAVRRCWGRRVKPSMPDRCRSVSAALSIDGTEPP